MTTSECVSARRATVSRYTSEAHDEGLVDVLTRMQREPYPGSAAGSTRESRSGWLRQVDMLERFVAVSAVGRVVGHVGLSRGGTNATIAGLPPDAREVVRLFVDPAWRGTGLGGTLLTRATASAVAAHPSAVLLVSDYLTQALDFYLSHGWSVVGSKISARSGDRMWVCRFESATCGQG